MFNSSKPSNDAYYCSLSLLVGGTNSNIIIDVYVPDTIVNDLPAYTVARLIKTLINNKEFKDAAMEEIRKEDEKKFSEDCFDASFDYFYADGNIFEQ